MPLDEVLVTTEIAALMARYTARPQASMAAIAAVWVDDLGDLTDEELRAGIRAHTRDPQEGRFWPTPAHLIAQLERLREVQRAAIEGPRVSPEEEWRKVDHAIRSFGGSDFGIKRAQDYLGADLWQALGGSAEYNRLRMVGLDELMSERARFCAARKAQVKRAEEDRRIGPVLEVLTGGGELTARKAPGLHVAESLPARVGGGR